MVAINYYTFVLIHYRYKTSDQKKNYIFVNSLRKLEKNRRFMVKKIRKILREYYLYNNL